MHNSLILLINRGSFLTLLIFLNKLALLLLLVGGAILGEVPLGEPLDGGEGLALQLEKREDREEGPEDEDEHRHYRIEVAAQEGHLDHARIEVDVLCAEVVLLHAGGGFSQNDHVVEAGDGDDLAAKADDRGQLEAVGVPRDQLEEVTELRVENREETHEDDARKEGDSEQPVTILPIWM